MSRLALYRKYRSADLEDLVGQDHITKTLTESLSREQISHAYLFTGPRGTGKTSAARILARRVNGLDSTEDTAKQLDIIEIDAASNRGIDEIRALREKINSSPTSLKYKVYIIDEAHMLTKEAFNALLKTLEEPPPHAIFILATTESNKLPDTIISRTQRFDFRPFSVAVIIAQLKSIAKSENITVTEDGLVAIAELSDGGMRDAISLLDQLSVLTDTIDASAVQSRMGLSSTQQIEQIVEATASGDTQLAIDLLTSTFDNGVEPSALCAQMQRFLRNILLQPEQPKQKKSAMNKDFAIRALEQLQLTQAGFKVASQRSLPLEIAIVKLSRPIPVLSTAAAASAIPVPAASVSAPPAPKPQTAQTAPASPPAAKPSADLTARCAKGLSIIKENNNSLYALLRSGNARIEGSKMVVDCRFNFHKERIEEFRNREMIEKIMTKVCEREIMLSCVMMHGKVEEPVKEDEELVSSAMAILGGELLDG